VPGQQQKPNIANGHTVHRHANIRGSPGNFHMHATFVSNSYIRWPFAHLKLVYSLCSPLSHETHTQVMSMRPSSGELAESVGGKVKIR
jgi:hypothetical protein